MNLRIAVVAIIAGLVTLTPVQAQDRLALVVGIDNYASLAKLQKATNDARAVGDTLTRLGFSVDLALDVDRRSFNRTLSGFLNKIRPGAIVYFHYSGHGISIDNDTFLLPADLDVPNAADREFVKREAVRLSELIDSFKTAQASARVIVVDACRDNPFAARGVRSIGSSRGLTLLPAPKGTLIMYSAADGQAALDTLGPNDREPTSVYTRTLLKHLATPGASLVDMARSVRREVEDLARTVGHEQRPAYYDELSDDLRLTPGAGAAPRPPTPPPSPPVASFSPSPPPRPSSPPAPAPTPPITPPAAMLPNTDMPGSDYHTLTLARPDPALCQAACRGDTRCASWTYVNPGVQGPQAFCWLKAVVPARVSNGCCTSGIEKAEPELALPPQVSPSVVGALRGIDMPGQDIRALDVADPGECQTACRVEARCTAWTYVRPGVQGPGARCWLKHTVPGRVTNPCCVSGIKR